MASTLEDSLEQAATGAKEMRIQLEAVVKTVDELGDEVVVFKEAMQKCQEKREREASDVLTGSMLHRLMGEMETRIKEEVNLAGARLVATNQEEVNLAGARLVATNHEEVNLAEARLVAANHEEVNSAVARLVAANHEEVNSAVARLVAANHEEVNSAVARIVSTIHGHFIMPPHSSEHPMETEGPGEEAKVQVAKASSLSSLQLKAQELKQPSLEQTGVLQDQPYTEESIRNLLGSLSDFSAESIKVLEGCMSNPRPFAEFLESSFDNVLQLQPVLTRLVQMERTDDLLRICKRYVQGVEARTQLIKQIEITRLTVKLCQPTTPMPSTPEISAAGREA